MIDLDDDLTAYGREWRSEQPPLPSLVVEHELTARRRSRWALVAAALVVVLALGVVAFVITRNHNSPPTVGTPTTTNRGFVPSIDVVPIYLPIDGADILAAGRVHDTLGMPMTAEHPTHAQVVQYDACQMAIAGPPTGRLFDFEDPGSYVGHPIAPTIAAPVPPPAVRCTEPAARAAARIRAIVTALDWHQQVTRTDGDATVAAARQQDLQCLSEHGVEGATFAFIPDPSGLSQAHPEWNSQIRTFVDCFTPVVTARAPVRQAFRESFIGAHAGEIADLQHAFDDYLSAIYATPPHAKTVTTEPDLARYDEGCIHVTNGVAPSSNSSFGAIVDPDTLLALARRAVDDPSGPIVRRIFGQVSVCDRSSIHDRAAWVFEFARKVVVLDETGKVLLTRTITKP